MPMITLNKTSSEFGEITIVHERGGAQMAHCRGTHRHRHTCNNLLYRCKKCHAVGCDQRDGAECTNQNFQQGKCNKCGETEKEPA